MKDKLTKIKVFLATTNDLHEESIEMADLIENMNYILERNNIHIYLTKWDYLDDESSSLEKNIKYDKTLEESDICIIAFGKEFGSYKEEELKKAFEKVCIKDINPKKLYVYFKNIDDLTEDLKKFRDSFPEEYGHFPDRFSEVNTLKNDFLLQFQLFQSQNLQNICPIEVEDSKVTIYGKDLFIDLKKIPFIGNNDKCNSLIDQINYLKEWLEEHEADHKRYSEKEIQLKEKENDLKETEKNIWSTGLQIAGIKGKRISKRLQEAIELFNSGDNKGANAILKTEDITAEIDYEINAKHYHQKVAEIHNENIKLLLEDFKFKVKTLKNEMPEGWSEEALKIHEKIAKYTKESYGENSEEYIDSLVELASHNITLGKNTEGLTLIRTAQNLTWNVWNDKDLKRGTFDHILSTIYLHGRGSTYTSLYYEKEAFKVYSSFFGSNHIKMLPLYLNFGEIYSRYGGYAQALFYLKKCLLLSKKYYGKINKNTCGIYFSLARHYKEIKKFKIAQYYFEEALWILNLIPGNNNLELIKVYRNLGDMYKQMNYLDNSLNYIQRAIEMMKQYNPTNKRDLYIWNLELIDIYVRQSNNITVEEETNKLLSSFKNESENERWYTEILDKISNIFWETRDFESFMQYKIKHLKLGYKMGAKPLVLIREFDSIGTSFRNIGRIDKALEIRLKSLNWYVTNSGANSEKTATAYNNVGAQYRDLGEYNKALEYIGKAYEISKKAKRTENEGLYLNRLGRVYALMGEMNTAKKKFEEALRLLPEDHSEAIDTRRRLEELGTSDLKRVNNETGPYNLR